MNQSYNLLQFHPINLQQLYLNKFIDFNTFQMAMLSQAQLSSVLHHQQHYPVAVPAYQHFENQQKSNKVYHSPVKSEACLTDHDLCKASTSGGSSSEEASDVDSFKKEESDMTLKSETSSESVQIHKDQKRTKKSEPKNLKDNIQTRLRPRRTVDCDHLIPQVQEIVLFFVARLEIANGEEIEREKQRYWKNDILFQVFDHLHQKYIKSNKKREDMTRFAIRRAMTFLRDIRRTEEKPKAKDASVALSKAYFAAKTELDDIADEDYLKLLPYKKNSINRTPNLACIARIFSSQAFCTDYKIYLENFDEIVKNDNQDKIRNLVRLLMVSIKNDKLHEIEKLSRLPWTDAWIRATKIVADELLTKNTQPETSGIVKKSESAKKIKTQ